MRDLEFLTGHVNFKLCYYQISNWKTPIYVSSRMAQYKCWPSKVLSKNQKTENQSKIQTAMSLVEIDLMGQKFHLIGPCRGAVKHFDEY